MKILLKYFALVFGLLLLTYCSELNENIPSVPKVSLHGEGVHDSSSDNYHVYSILASPNGMYDCQQCHASDFSGGSAGVGCNTSECHPTIIVHQQGINDPTSSNFHGVYIKDSNWDMRSCQQCHGSTYAGGEASPSCISCHVYPAGPENCTTCHGSPTSNAPPEDLEGNTETTFRGVGAHQVHLKGNIVGRNLTCAQCHVVPGSVYGDAGHIDSEHGAEVLMNEERANLITNEPTTSQYDPSLPLFVPDPQYSAPNLTCANTYCHGYFKNGNLTNAPIWTDPSTSSCGTCHGSGSNPLPKTSAEGGTHPNDTNCSNCHGGVVDANQNIINPSKHIDGKLNLNGNDIDF